MQPKTTAKPIDKMLQAVKAHVWDIDNETNSECTTYEVWTLSSTFSMIPITLAHERTRQTYQRLQSNQFEVIVHHVLIFN